MLEETVVAAPSAAEESHASTVEVDRGPLVNLTGDQRAEFRRTGELPSPSPKKEESAPSPEAKKEAETVTASEADKQQEKPAKAEKPKQTAEERIAQLEATIEKIRKGAGLKEAPRSEAKTEPKQPEQPQNYQEWRKAFKPADWIDKYAKDNPEASYEDANAAMADYLSDVRDQFRTVEQQQAAQASELNAKVEAARSRYENFDEVKDTFLEAVSQPSVNPAVRDMLNDSDVLVDLIYTIGSSEKELAAFLKMPPGKALRYIALTESLIHEELEGAAKPKGEAKTEPPAKPQTTAPRPPAEVGGRAASPGDALESAAKAGDFRAFKAEATRRQLEKMKG